MRPAYRETRRLRSAKAALDERQMLTAGSKAVAKLKLTAAKRCKTAARLRAALRETRGSAMVEAAVVLPLIVLCGVGLLHLMAWMYSTAEKGISERAEEKWKVEREAQWIRNGELIDAQIPG